MFPLLFEFQKMMCLKYIKSTNIVFSTILINTFIISNSFGAEYIDDHALNNVNVFSRCLTHLINYRGFDFRGSYLTISIILMRYIHFILK